MTQLLELRELLAGEDRPAVHALRAEMLGSELGNTEVETELLRVLSAANLPDLVLADKGAVALKSDRGYTFVEAETEPSVVVLMDQLLQHLSSTTDGETPKKALDIMRAHLGLRLEPVGEDLPIPILAPPVSSLD